MIEFYEKVVTIEPKNLNGATGLALMIVAKNKFDTAMSYFDSVYRHNI